jgi:hypothetical protein
VQRESSERVHIRPLACSLMMSLRVVRVSGSMSGSVGRKTLGFEWTNDSEASTHPCNTDGWSGKSEGMVLQITQFSGSALVIHCTRRAWHCFKQPLRPEHRKHRLATSVSGKSMTPLASHPTVRQGMRERRVWKADAFTESLT